MEGYARYRAPSESGQKLVVPPWNELGDLLRANRQWRAAAEGDLSGRSLAELSRQGRRELIMLARRYTEAYAGELPPSPDADEAPLILTGHQPGLVHPGVWLKNFAAGALAESHRGVAVHLVIDVDACRATAINVPAGSVESPRLAAVPFDQAAAPEPWEDRPILDADCWRSFPSRVREAGGALLREPFLDDWWPTAIERGQATGRLGPALTQARHLAEIAWGCRNLELPQSQVCQTSTFRWFVAHLLNHLPQFAAAYNDSLAAYRRAHRLRNHAHPVPNLAAMDGWLEAPLWMWTAADQRRRAVFARLDARGVIVSDRGSFERRLPLAADGLDDAVAELARWEAEGFKLRSRALVTTMFARLVLADLFIHGIGGAKYDEATDDIARRFFGLAPPGFVTLSGTLHLPIDHPAVDEANVQRLRHRLRDLEFHPEVYVRINEVDGASRATAAAAIAQKKSWIAAPQTPANAAERHHAIVSANRQLQPLLVNDRRQVEAALAAELERLRAARILQSRELAFCLYPAPQLKKFLLDFPARVL